MGEAAPAEPDRHRRRPIGRRARSSTATPRTLPAARLRALEPGRPLNWRVAPQRLQRQARSHWACDRKSAGERVAYERRRNSVQCPIRAISPVMVPGAARARILKGPSHAIQPPLLISAPTSSPVAAIRSSTSPSGTPSNPTRWRSIKLVSWSAVRAWSLPAAATSLRQRDGGRLVQDGPFADTKEQLGGFFIIDVPDLDAALEWAARYPAGPAGARRGQPNRATRPPRPNPRRGRIASQLVAAGASVDGGRERGRRSSCAGFLRAAHRLSRGAHPRHRRHRRRPFGRLRGGFAPGRPRVSPTARKPGS